MVDNGGVCDIRKYDRSKENSQDDGGDHKKQFWLAGEYIMKGSFYKLHITFSAKQRSIQM
jgi:hypothetical protein